MRHYITALCGAFLISLTLGSSAFAQPLQPADKGVKQQRVKINSNVNKNKQININTAPVKKLVVLKGIGIKKAMKIVKDRQENGAFATPMELTRIKGIGKRTVEKNLDRITVGDGKTVATQRDNKASSQGKESKLKEKIRNRLSKAPKSVKKAAKERQRDRKAKQMNQDSVD